MTRSLFAAILAIGALTACSQPSVAKCSRNSECPRDAICVSGICQKGVPSGGSTAQVAGSTRLTGGTLTLDAVVGQPVAPTSSAGNLKLKPAENTR